MLKQNISLMKNSIRKLIVVLIGLLIVNLGSAEEFVGAKKNVSKYKGVTAGCAPPSSFRFLDINNVRARINTGGDMWWDLPGGIGAQYFIPKEGTATSLFSGSLWIGGLDINDQLKLAGLRYRQIGQDYWTGPLTVDGTAAIDENVCAEWDKHFLMERAMVDDFLAWWESDNKSEDYPDYVIPNEILEWPAHGDESKDQSFYLAPFNDVDGDGIYDPFSGDYPYYDIDNSLCPLNRQLNPDDPPARTYEELYTDYTVKVWGSILSDQVIKGDQTLWWIFNDKGNNHTETDGAAIGLEIRAQAFAFSTNDEINNMTFYSYEIINRSTFELTNTFFSPWVDTDLGYAWDDYVGCDVSRGLGYCYNGNAIDGQGQVEAYGDQPPAVGVDFFQGPYIDEDGRDNPKFTGDCSIINSPYQWDQMALNGVNFGNNIVDDERFGMRRFVYHNNSGGIQGDPRYAPEYYNYLRGFWKDNTRMLYGGNAHVNSGALGPECNFMFPGDSDPCNWGTVPPGTPPNGGFNQNGYYWTEEIVGNQPSDRRFMQSAGPFSLLPGAVNYITVGLPWARATSGGPWASVELLRSVDDKCQKLFENCFKVLDGPDAPDITLIELDRELVMLLSNSKTSNNYNEKYAEYDNRIPQPVNPDEPRNDSIYRFEGYQIFQLADATVSVESLHDPDKARLIAQFDKQNGVTTLINYYKNQTYDILEAVVEVEGGDNGISHSFTITDDAFAAGDNRLVNFKQYYYIAIAYAFNEFKVYNPNNPNMLDGQKEPYLAGRKNIQTHTAIPHKPINGQVLNSDYGERPQITRLDGQGNGGMNVEMTAATIQEILDKKPVGSTGESGQPVVFGDPDYPIAYEPVYEIGFGPVNVKVVDPLNVKAADYILKFVNVEHPIDDSIQIESAKWELIDQQTGEIYTSDTTIDVGNEQILIDLGLSLEVEQILPVGDTFSINYGFISAHIQYADSSQQWFSGVEDNNVPASPQNWIRSGTYKNEQQALLDDWNMPGDPWDPFQHYDKIGNGIIAPYGLCAGKQQNNAGPAMGKFNSSTPANIDKQISRMRNLYSIDLVLTDDRSKWTRALVIETCLDPELSESYPDGREAEPFMVRAGQSVDKDGNPAPMGSGPSTNPEDPNYINESGMGWFPGYAINLETGERLNIMYGEDSWLVGQNGRDMMFNPTKRNLEVNEFFDPNIYNQVNGDVLFGGKHYIYVFGHNTISYEQSGKRYDFASPAYDACKWARIMLDTLTGPDAEPFYPSLVSYFYGNILYAGIPMGVEGEEWLSNDVTIKIRVAKPYQRYLSRPATTEQYEPKNDFNPMYRFSTQSIATEEYVVTKAETDLDLINIVPNPYYAYSSYENNSLDNRVKLTNLPERCTITIYNVKGQLIRQYKKDSPITYLDWDLKNFAGVPIAGGLYLVHVKSDLGERVIKWFGSLRTEDLNIF